MENLKTILLWKKVHLCITIFVLVFLFLYIYSQITYSKISSKLIRLHVIANSDSDFDQSIKLLVRDEILKYMRNKSENSNSLIEVKNLVNNNLKEIEDLAVNVLNKNNINYSVKAYFGNFDFPTKNYGDISLPAGNYNSVRVVLGEGKGKNWWCVMFPPLCYVDGTSQKVDDKYKEHMKTVLSDEEYKIVTSKSKDSKTSYKIKFKIVEVFQNTQNLFSKK